MKGTEALRDTRRPSQGAIARLAYKFYEDRGGQPGYELEDWLRAEETLLLDERRSRSREKQIRTVV